MLTRLRIKGFKSLADAEVSFGPFTCIAGGNGVGKSNLFDAIQFLRDLTEFPIIEAAARVRDPRTKTGDLRGIFTQDRLGRRDTMEFEADFIVPRFVLDDFNRKAEPTATFLRYQITLRYVAADGNKSERIELAHESLTYLPKNDAATLLGFRTHASFRDSVIHNERRAPYISTTNEGMTRIVKLHQDGGSSGRPFQVPPETSPKTIVGGINTTDYPTVLAARREMQQWTLLQLEPSSLRQPDNFSDETRVSANGAHMPSTLLRLGAEAEISNRLSELLPDVGAISVEKDESRRTHTLMLTGGDHVSHPARSLSDGTLRFIALAIIAADPESGRLLCLEEPENGIHPSRIPAILKLLRGMTVDTTSRVSEDNPLRQVIINTHSPIVVTELPVDDLLVSSIIRQAGSNRSIFECVSGTWREKRDTEQLSFYKVGVVPRGNLLDYVTNSPSANKQQNSSDEKSVGQFMFEQMKFDFPSSPKP